MQAPSTFRWAYYHDILGEDAGLLCLGWVTYNADNTTALVGYNMRAEVVSLPGDARVFWAKDKPTVVSSESVLWNIEVTPRTLDRKETVPPGHTPPELDYQDAVKSLTQMPALVAAQWAKLRANVLQKASREKKRQSMYHQSKARREKHKERQRALLDTPSPIKKAISSRRTRVPESLKALLNATDLEDLESPSFPDFSKLSLINPQ
jgi:hypothetical protein